MSIAATDAVKLHQRLSFIGKLLNFSSLQQKREKIWLNKKCIVQTQRLSCLHQCIGNLTDAHSMPSFIVSTGCSKTEWGQEQEIRQMDLTVAKINLFSETLAEFVPNLSKCVSNSWDVSLLWLWVIKRPKISKKIWRRIWFNAGINQLNQSHDHFSFSERSLQA